VITAALNGVIVMGLLMLTELTPLKLWNGLFETLSLV